MFQISLKFLGIVAIAILLQACGGQPKAETSCNFVQNRYKQRVSWEKDVPITLYIHESVPLAAQADIQLAMEDWNVSVNRQILRFGGVVSGKLGPSEDNHNVIYWMREWDQDKVANEQARTTIYWSGKQITEADVQINTNLNISYGAENPNGIDLRSLALHEFGHVMGLAHNHESETVMAETLLTGVKRRDPQIIDVQSLKCEY